MNQLSSHATLYKRSYEPSELCDSNAIIFFIPNTMLHFYSGIQLIKYINIISSLYHCMKYMTNEMCMIFTCLLFIHDCKRIIVFCTCSVMCAIII